MVVLVLGLVLFLGVHSLQIVKPDIRANVITRRGRGAWSGPYALVSLIGFILIVVGYGLARQAPTVLYAPPLELRHVALALMLPVFPLLFAAYLPGRIGATLRHPMLIATALWGLAHLLANGTLADLLLFGAVGIWAIADIVSLAQRPAKAVPSLPRGSYNDIMAVIGGLAVYAAFMGGLHYWLIGVSPI